MAIVALFAKSLETFQAIYILVRNCFYPDTKNLLRILFETMVTIYYCAKGEDEFKRYLAKDAHSTIDLYNCAIQDKDNLSTIPQELLEKKKKSAEDQLANIGNPSIISLEGMARSVGQIKNYHIIYRNVSTSVHSHPRSLEDFIEYESNNEISGFVLIPKIESIVNSIFISIDFMITIFKVIEANFSLPQEMDIPDFDNRASSLIKRFWVGNKI